MASGSYERMMADKTKEDLGIALHELLDTHRPEIYFGRGGRTEYFCRTCATSSEEYEPEDAPIAACHVWDVLHAFEY